MVSLLIVTAAILGSHTSVGNFHPATVLDEGKNTIGMAGQGIIQEGDADGLLFPSVEAWYDLGLGFGDFTVKLNSPVGLRGGFKARVGHLLEIPLSVELAGSAAQKSRRGPGTGICTIAIRFAAPRGAPSESTFCNLTESMFGVELVARADIGNFTLAPKAVLEFIRLAPDDGFEPSDSFGRFLGGVAVTRHLKTDTLTWMVELAFLWGRSFAQEEFSKFIAERTFLLFAPGIGISLEF